MYTLNKNLFYVHMSTNKFFRTVYQERLVFYYFKVNIKRYPKMKECIFNNETPKAPLR